MTAALKGGEWSAARPGRTLPPGKTRYTFYRRLVGPQDRSGRAENLFSTGIRSPDRPARSSVAIRTELPYPQRTIWSSFKNKKLIIPTNQTVLPIYFLTSKEHGGQHKDVKGTRWGVFNEIFQNSMLLLSIRRRNVKTETKHTTWNICHHYPGILRFSFVFGSFWRRVWILHCFILSKPVQKYINCDI